MTQLPDELSLSNAEWFLALDDGGFPVLKLARTHTAPPQPGGPTRTVVTRSGNPWHDPNSGKFGDGPPGVAVRQGGDLLKSLLNSSKQLVSQRASATGADGIAAIQGPNGHVMVQLYKGGQLLATFQVASQATPPDQARNGDPGGSVRAQPDGLSTVPEGVDPEEWHRRMDAVRAAAREFDNFGTGDAKEFLHGVTQRELTDQEIAAFVSDVRDARINDLVDYLDQSLRRSDLLRRRSRRIVRVVPPRGFIQRSLSHLDDNDIVEIVNRLTARGLPRQFVSDRLNSRFDVNRQAILAPKIGAKGNEDTGPKVKPPPAPDTSKGN